MSEEDNSEVRMRTPETIQAGDGATMQTNGGALMSPFTVVETRRKGTELVLQRDGRLQRVTVTKRKDGTYVEKGQPLLWYSTRFVIGVRRNFVDVTQ